MSANFEVIAYRNHKRHIFYYVSKIYSGVAVNIRDKFKALGYKSFSTYDINLDKLI